MPRTINVRIGQRPGVASVTLLSSGALSTLAKPILVGGVVYTGAGVLGAQAVGYIEPTTSNTGIAGAGFTTSDLTIINGDLSIDDTYVSNNGSTLDKLWVKGHVLYTATTPVTITRSQIQGRTFGTAGSPPYEVIVRARRTSAPATARLNLEYCTLTCVQPDVNLSIAAGERLGYVHYCDISLGSDGLDFWNPSPPKAMGNYFHDYSFWDNDSKHTSDATHPGWSHNDWIQCSGNGGGPGYVIGNSFDMRAAVGVGNVSTLTAGGFASRNYGCCVMLTPGNGHIQNMDIHDNWFRYGEVHVAMPQQNSATDNGNSWQVYNNKHNYPHGYGPYSGNYSMQFIRWGYPEGPVPADVFNNKLLLDANVPTALRGTSLPTATLVGGAVASGQYIVSLNNPTQV